MTGRGLEFVETAGQIGALGLDPMRFLETKSDFERNLILKVAEQVAKNRQMMDKNLAIEIANNLGKVLGN
jgi:hypothetical protein